MGYLTPTAGYSKFSARDLTRDPRLLEQLLQTVKEREKKQTNDEIHLHNSIVM